MARRSPMNPRYKKDAQVGTTRRSAASAKPKRAASSGSGSSSSSGSSKKSGSGIRGGSIQLPPETKKLQRIVFILLGIAVVISALFLWKGKELPNAVGSITIGVSYGLLFVALYIDFTKVRPVTKALRAGQPIPVKLTKAGKALKADKTEKGDSGAASKAAEGSDTERKDA